jgi:hypothetical protein
MAHSAPNLVSDQPMPKKPRIDIENSNLYKHLGPASVNFAFCCDQFDPISLEKIWNDVDGARQALNEIKWLFSYYEPKKAQENGSLSGQDEVECLFSYSEPEPVLRGTGRSGFSEGLLSNVNPISYFIRGFNIKTMRVLIDDAMKAQRTTAAYLYITHPASRSFLPKQSAMRLPRSEFSSPEVSCIKRTLLLYEVGI